MEEDEAGLRHELGSVKPAVPCGSCGRMVVAGEERRLESARMDEAGSPYTVVCESCFRAIEAGEVDLATVDEPER